MTMEKLTIATIEGVPVIQDEPDEGHAHGRVHFTAKAAIDADGAYRAYHPKSQLGLDDLANAGHPGNWWGIVTDSKGRPFLQQSHDPYPGFYVSSTAYEWKGYAKSDPKRYVDSESVPYVVVSPLIRNAAKGIVLGCKARITNSLTGQHVDAVVADIGPRQKIGEVSIAAAKAIGLSGSARSGGTERKIIAYELWPGIAAVVNGITYDLISAS